jgi:hypothetical protein
MPQPCIGVCIWRPAEWVNVAVYEGAYALAEPSLRAARSLSRLLARVAAVTPRPGQAQQNRQALQAQARAALAEYDPDVRAPEPPSNTASAEDPEPAIRVGLWPR